MAYKNIGKNLTLESVNEDDIQVTLSDGSIWDIKTGDIYKIATWYETQRIVVSKSKNPSYPYLLTNIDTSAPDKAEASIETK